jgi:hypothetical protein
MLMFQRDGIHLGNVGWGDPNQINAMWLEVLVHFSRGCTMDITIPRVFELHNLHLGEMFVMEDLIGKRKQLSLGSKSPKPISHRPESEKESGVGPKPISIKSHIREIQIIPEK